MNEQKWRLKGTQITGETIGSHFVFYPDGWPDGCYMYVHPDMLEPADVPKAAPPSNMEERVKALEEQADRHATWLKPISDAVMFRLTHIEAALDWQDDGAHTLIDLERRVKTLEAAPDLGQRVKTLEECVIEWGKRVVRIENVLETNPAPDQPLKVGDEVWVKGVMEEVDMSSRPFRIDFGHDDIFWLYKDAKIKRA